MQNYFKKKLMTNISEKYINTDNCNNNDVNNKSKANTHSDI